MVSFSQCASTKMFQNDLPFKIGEAYYQELNSGVHVFIPIKSNPKSILLHSVYFQGNQAKLELENDLLKITEEFERKEKAVLVKKTLSPSFRTIAGEGHNE